LGPFRILENHGLYGPDRDQGGDEITFVASLKPMMTGWEMDKAGFVDIDVHRFKVTRAFDVVSQEKRLVGGCPTTLIVEALDTANPGDPSQAIYLVVHPKGGSMSYLFEAHGIEGEKSNQDVKELKAIRDSVQLVTPHAAARHFERALLRNNTEP
jgi:hypothetical protein